MDNISLESLLITEEEWAATEGFFHRKKPVPLPEETPEEKREREAFFAKLSPRIRAASRRLLAKLKHPLGYSIYTKESQPDHDTWRRFSPSSTWWEFDTIEIDVEPIARKLNMSIREAGFEDTELSKWKTVGSIPRAEMTRLYKEEIQKDPILKAVNLNIEDNGEYDMGYITVSYNYKKEKAATEGFFPFRRKKKSTPHQEESPEEREKRERELSKLSQRIRAVSRKLLSQSKHPVGYSLYDEEDSEYDESSDGVWWFNAIDYDVWPIAKKLNMNARDIPDLPAGDSKWKAAGTVALDKMTDLLEAAIREDAVLKQFSLSVEYGGDWDGGPIGVNYRYA